MKELWVEKWRPTRVEDYVFKDDEQKAQVKSWIASGAISHLMFSGSPGTGKSTLAKLLLHELNVDWGDVLFINASVENGIDEIRHKITNFCSTMPFGEYKYVFMDEADGLSPASQGALRGVMETFSNTCRFLLTCVTGDTLIYTPYGYKNIEDTKVNDNVISGRRDIQKNNKLIVNTSSTIYKIKTLHGFEIKATGDHLFRTINDQKKAKDLKINDTIPIDIKSIYGNHFKYEESNNFFNKEDFDLFLSQKGILSKSELQTILKHKHLLFSKNQRLIYDHIIQNNICSFNVPDLSNNTGVTRAVIHNFLYNIKSYILNSEWTSQNKYTYVIDIDNLKKDVTIADQNFPKWNNLRLRNYQTKEDIISTIPEFTDYHILSMGRIVGFFEGDGHLSPSGSLHVAANNEETLVKIYNDITKFVNIPLNIKKNGRNTNCVCITPNNKTLSLLLEYFGASVGNKSKNKRVLSRFSSNKLFFKGFIQGFYDADGKQFTINNDLSCSPLLITQSIYDDSHIQLLEDIKDKLLYHFNIDTRVEVYTDTSVSTYGGSTRFMKLISCTNESIIKFLESIGNYYDKKESDDILGYLKYKKEYKGYNFLRFSEWKNKFYGFGLINDIIVSIDIIKGEHKVYDCSFIDYHWYVTNGFLSHNCNYPHKIIPAIHSRCQGFHIERLDKTEFTARVAQILISEDVQFELDVLDTFVSAAYPDLRKCIGLAQQNSQTGKLKSPSREESGTSDFKVEMIALFKAGKIKEARTLICKNASAEDYDSIFRFLYENTELWGDTYDKQARAIIIIRNGLVNDTLVADREINMSAVLVELELLSME